MLLRSLTKHVKDQNWFAVFLDFFIVVAGILIAFQITNWSERRGDARQKAEFMRSVADDLGRDRAEYQTGRDSAIVTISSANYILESAGMDTVKALTLPVTANPLLGSNDGQIPVPPSIELSPDQKQRLWSSIVVVYFPSANPTAFDSLVSTGNLGIITDETFLLDLQTYRQVIDELSGTQSQTFSVFRTLAVETGQNKGLSPFMRMPEDEFIDLVKNNKDLAASIRIQLVYSVLHLRQIEVADTKAAELLADIEERDAK